MFEEPATPTFRKSPAATVALDADSRPGIFRSVSGEPKIAPRLVARVFVVFIAIFLNHITIAQEETGHSGLPPGVVARLGTHRFVHHGRLQTLSFSPDGTAIFAVTEDEACLWDVQKGNRRVEFEIQPGRPATIMCGGMSHDWKTAILAENGPLLYVFDVATGQHKAILRGAKERAYAVALSADGRMAASGDANEVILWDTTEAKELRRFPLVRKLIGPHPSLIGALRFSPDNKRLAIATLPVGGEMWIQDIVGKDAPLHLEGATGSDAWFAFSPDGKTLAGSSKEFVSGKQDLPLRVWDVSTGRRLLGMPRVADCGVYSPDGRRLLTASGFTSSGFNEVIIYDASTGKEQHRLSVGHAHINAVAFSPEGRMLATGMDRRIQLWDTATWQEVNPASGHTESVQTLAFAPDGRTIASGGRDGSVILWSWPEGKETRRIEKLGSSWGVERLAFAPDSRRIVATAPVFRGDMISVFDATAGALVSHFGKGHFAHGAVFSSDGKEVLGGKGDGSIGVWDAVSGAWKQAAGRFKASIRAVQPIPGSSKVWWAGEYQSLGLRDLATGEDERVLTGALHHSDTHLAVSPDGSWLAMGMRVWDLKSGEIIAPGNPGQETFAAISPDSRVLAAIWREDVVLWEALTRQEIHRFQIATRPVNALTFSPDGTVLAVAANADVLVWDMTGRLRERRLRPVDLAQVEMECLWESLGSDEAWSAHQAAWTLAGAGRQAAEFLAARLHPATVPTPAQITALRDRLRDPDYDVRDHAARELQDSGIEVRPEDREALRRPEPDFFRAIGDNITVRLKPPPVLLPLPERVRTSRAVMALEHSTAPETESLLNALSGGAPDAPLTREAKSALDRVRQRLSK